MFGNLLIKLEIILFLGFAVLFGVEPEEGFVDPLDHIVITDIWFWEVAVFVRAKFEIRV